ncbi:MAG: GNAT family N-acetyltransferase [Hyphomicrobiaceae bacterium]
MIPRRATPADLDAIVALQHAAYAWNRERLGVEPLPLQADYAQILATMEVWLADSDAGDHLDGVLILNSRADDMLIWSVATDPDRQGLSIGRSLLHFAETRANAIGRDTMRLYTGSKLTERVQWYERHGYETERIEEMSDRSVTHMVKRLNSAA